jgi:hypothetical protein
MTPAAVVARQVDAYNAHDLERFVATYSDTIRIYRLPAIEPAISGKGALARFYGTQRFNRPALRAEVVHRIELGNKVVDHERIWGLEAHVVEAVAVYEVVAGLIQNAWFFAPE